MRCKGEMWAHSTVVWGTKHRKIQYSWKDWKDPNINSKTNCTLEPTGDIGWLYVVILLMWDFPADRPAAKHQLTTKRGLHCYIWLNSNITYMYNYSILYVYSDGILKKMWHADSNQICLQAGIAYCGLSLSASPRHIQGTESIGPHWSVMGLR